ncbi:MAG TPA: trypsin-like peptidase domain-containing protein, partial [Gemmataceae bacterium]|nr:trypsin-like peptidase domain-containing protein [Gemmataceae bacterium]
MTIRIECPGCRAKLTIPEELQGKQIRCPKCKMLTVAGKGAAGDPGGKSARPSATVPKQSSGSSEAITSGRPVPSRPSRTAREDDDATRRPPKTRRTFRDDEDDEDSEDRPRRRKKQQQSATPWLVAGVGAGLALVGAIVVALLIGGSSPSKPQAEAKIDQPPVARPTRQNSKPRPPIAEAPPTQVEIPQGPTPREIDPASMKRVKKATAYLRVRLGNGTVAEGSGFFAAEKGLVFTNAHVLGMLNPSSPAPTVVEVVTNSGERGETTRRAKVLGVDRESDLGVLRVGGDDAALPDPLPLDTAQNLTELQKVYVFGFPFGKDLGKNITISESAVSSIRREPDGSVHQVQVNGGIHPGNSGGPVVDSRGVVIGVSVAGIRGTLINFAVPGEKVQGMLWGRVAELSVGEAYLKDATTKLPVEIH